MNILNAQATVMQRLRQEIVEKSRGGAYLLVGELNSGKLLAAREITRELFCRLEKKLECSCSNCQKLGRDTHPDLCQLTPKEGLISIEAVREAILHLKYPALEAKNRVVIINQAETMNQHAANALLKTLEEPPTGALLILMTSAPEQLLPTLLSRLHRFQFAPLTSENRAELLTISLEQAQLLTVIKLPQLSHEALTTKLNQLLNQREALIKILTGCLPAPQQQSSQVTQLWQLSELLQEEEAECVERLALLTSLWRELAYQKLNFTTASQLSESNQGEIAKLANKLSLPWIIKQQTASEKIAADLQNYGNRKIAIEALISTMTEPQ